MRVGVLVVGRTGALLAPAVEEYEKRAARYWTLEVSEVRPAGGRDPVSARGVEAERLLGRVPIGHDVVALTRTGDAWSSERLAEYLSQLAVRAAPGAMFVIGGAFGLGDAVLEAARHRMRLSSMTLPHELARLVLAEQLYRAGTIVRGEPYHKGRG